MRLRTFGATPLLVLAMAALAGCLGDREESTGQPGPGDDADNTTGNDTLDNDTLGNDTFGNDTSGNDTRGNGTRNDTPYSGPG